VHLAWTGHPIDGDPLFSKATADGPGRTLLHSWRLGFAAAWAGGARIRAEAPPGADFWASLGGTPPALPDWDTAAAALAAGQAGQAALR
jgi:tRNA pseudouridine32 synthase/23S rRNA pseudouridine746 synthase